MSGSAWYDDSAKEHTHGCTPAHTGGPKASEQRSQRSWCPAFGWRERWLEGMPRDDFWAVANGLGAPDWNQTGRSGGEALVRCLREHGWV